MPSDGLRRVLIVDPAFLGDAVFSAALAREVVERNPGCEVGLVLRPPADRLAPFMPHVTRVHRFDKRGADRGRRGVRRLAAEIEARGYERALVPHPSFRSTYLAARARIPERIGSAPGWLARRPLTEHRAVPEGAGFVASRLALLDDPEGARASLKGALAVPPEEVEPRGARRRVGLVLGSEWATKRWPVDNAAALVHALDPGRHALVWLGASKERALYEALAARGAPPGLEIVDAVGEPIEALVRRIAGLEVLVAGDTGPLHVARALGVPAVALFGPTDPERHVPGPEDRVLTVPLECRPCSVHGQDRCPEGHHRCLVDLDGPRVARAVVTALEGRAR